MGTSAQCGASNLPWEIVLAGTPIVVRFEQPISRDSLGGIGVKGQTAATQIADDTLSVTVDTSALPDGAHTLTILGASQLKGRERLADATLPFLIVHSPAKIPAEIAIIHAARLRIGKLGIEHLAMRRDAEAPWVDAFKAIDRKSGKPLQFASDHTGERNAPKKSSLAPLIPSPRSSSAKRGIRKSLSLSKCHSALHHIA